MKPPLRQPSQVIIQELYSPKTHLFILI